MGVLKSQRRRLVEALTAKDATVAEKEFVLLTKKLDQNAAKNKIHPNKAARTKLRPIRHLSSSIWTLASGSSLRLCAANSRQKNDRT